MKTCKCRLLPAAPSLLIPIASIGLSAWILRHLGFLVGLFIESGEGDKFDCNYSAAHQIWVYR